jgi:hypothetical protein
MRPRPLLRVPRLLKVLQLQQLAWRPLLLVRWMLLLVQPLVLRQVTPARLLLRMRPVHMVPAWRLLLARIQPTRLALRPLVLQRPLLPTRPLLLRAWRLLLVV